MKPKNLKILSAFLIVAVVIIFGVVFSRSDAPDRYSSEAGLLEDEIQIDNPGGGEGRKINFCFEQQAICIQACNEFVGDDKEYIKCANRCSSELNNCIGEDISNPIDYDDLYGDDIF